ncbi:uncharacterized protein LOC118194730 [Stegodyphus dumicola]|uniref:uncharacterized protein LOC118194730 n=1 Tax=Stegodyphus dumicola TaxID=202533 RepID=UPI0015A77573|nr:uncharacterized protein LOC118194730 [Stegodyphus dumicola]
MESITLVLAGDFRQTLPVAPRGTRTDQMHACLKSSYIWNEIHRLHLRSNMRVQINGDTTAQEFADNLLKLGNGFFTPNKKDGCISVECIGNIVKSHQDPLLAIFPNLRQHFTDHSWLCERSILAPKNYTVRAINKQLLGQLPGSVKIYKSVVTMCSTDEAVNYPTEFLNSLELPGVPSHILELKVGAPIMLLRNLDPPSLCNGTRLSV